MQYNELKLGMTSPKYEAVRGNAMACNKDSFERMSDSVLVMIPLTLSGGLQDAYSYFMREGTKYSTWNQRAVLVKENDVWKILGFGSAPAKSAITSKSK